MSLLPAIHSVVIFLTGGCCCLSRVNECFRVNGCWQRRVLQRAVNLHAHASLQYHAPLHPFLARTPNKQIDNFTMGLGLARLHLLCETSGIVGPPLCASSAAAPDSPPRTPPPPTHPQTACSAHGAGASCAPLRAPADQVSGWGLCITLGVGSAVDVSGRGRVLDCVLSQHPGFFTHTSCRISHPCLLFHPTTTQT